MLVRGGINRIIPFLLISTLLLILLGAKFYFPKITFTTSRIPHEPVDNRPTWSMSTRPKDAGKVPTEELPPFVPTEHYHQLFANSTFDGKLFKMDFGDYEIINPNMIPHPQLNDTWIVVGQMEGLSIAIAGVHSIWCAEMVCNAHFKDGKLSCIRSPLLLPIAATEGGKCKDKLVFLNFNVGPHDARLFYGPNTPYLIYGSNSHFTCFGQWIMDFRYLVDWGFEGIDSGLSIKPVELQRPRGAWNTVEKNWFLFWDANETTHVHYDIYPRSFAKLKMDGTVGKDLALSSKARKQDDVCLQKYLPKLDKEFESIHQATNSLSITMCSRSDPTCQANSTNTFIFAIFQHKSFFQYHSVYEPYVIVFQDRSPFKIMGISEKPLWITGRSEPGKGKTPQFFGEADKKVWWQTGMVYVSSISWRQAGQKYHGFADDMVFISFGIEDTTAGGMDVVASDLLHGLGVCD